MAVFMEMNQYVVLNGDHFFQDETGGLLKPVLENQRLRQPKYGWCARVCVDIAIAYALQKTIFNLNGVCPNLTRKVTFNGRGHSKHSRNILIGGLAEHIYKVPSQWRNGGLFELSEKTINDFVINVMEANKLWDRPDGEKRLAPVFTEHSSGDVSSRLGKIVEFLEEEITTSRGIKYRGLRVCFLQFSHVNRRTRHECIVCGTNLSERTQNPDLIPMVDIYNPWGNIAYNVNPNDLYSLEKAKHDGIEKEIRKIFRLDKKSPIDHILETVRLFSFKWWK